MKYKGEAIKNKKVIEEGYFNGGHPREVTRKLVSLMKDKNKEYDRSIIYIANEAGEKWMFSVKRTNGTTFVRPIKSSSMLNQDELDMIFSGNQRIVET